MAMTNSTSRHDYIKELKREYGRARLRKDRVHKTQLLDQAETMTGLHRKYLIRLLNNRRMKRVSPIVNDRTHGRGRKPIYDSSEFTDALLSCWKATNCSCAENLQPYLLNLVPQLERCGELVVSANNRERLLKVSTSTIARKLKAHKAKDRQPLGVSTTRPGDTLKQSVAVRKGRWAETEPGCVEVDTVAHCGEANKGTYVHSYDFVDIATSWSEQVAAMGIGERATVAAINETRKRFPFAIVAIDSDNGSEFLNWHLHRYCKDDGITFTRSRPYKKNDNAHVEQKNDTAIRKMVGYHRYDTPEQLAILSTSPFNEHLVSFLEPGGVSRWAHS